MKVEKIGANSIYRQNSAQSESTSKLNPPEYKQIKELSNVYYKPIYFGKKLAEHKSWGAIVDPKTKEVNFKIFTYPDAKSVSVNIESRKSKDVKEIVLENKGNGVFEKTNVSPSIAKEGDKYSFVITKSDESIEVVKDPYSFKQEELDGSSTIYDQTKYKWKNNEKWLQNPERITRTSNGKDGFSSLEEARIYALSPDTLTEDRSYEGVISKLKEIKEKGFNAVEIMHIENTFSFNWGYDGVDKLAPSNYLGGPDKLKKLVDAAHGEGLNVIFDVVPNHIGPDGNHLGRSGPYVKGPNAFGDAWKFEGEDSEHVRDLMINGMLNWAENYHIDGLRLDMTKYMESDFTLKQLAAEMNYHYPDVFLIAEDSRQNVRIDDKGNPCDDYDEPHDMRVTNKLLTDEYGGGMDEDTHEKALQVIYDQKDTSILARLGMDSEWDFNFYHRLDEAMYWENISALSKAIEKAQTTVKYRASHDEIGNHEGTRKLAKYMVPKLRLEDCMDLDEQDEERAIDYADSKFKDIEEARHIVKCQKVQLASEKLAILYQTGALDEFKTDEYTSDEEAKRINDALYEKYLKDIGILPNKRISYTKIQRAFEEAYNQEKMASALVYGIPGPKMVFQGDESLDLTPFRFFRRFKSNSYEKYLYTEKGYQPAEPALEESTMGRIQYSKDGEDKMKGFSELTADLNKLNKENTALSKGKIEKDSMVEHNISNVLAFNTKDEESGNEIFVVSNFGKAGYSFKTSDEYGIVFPKGIWQEVLNTDDVKYNGSGKYINYNSVISNENEQKKSINLAPNSTIYFKKIA